MIWKPKYQFYIYFVIASLLISYIFFYSNNNIPSSQNIVDEISLVDKLGFLNLHDSVKYVGIEKCKQCHLEMYESYIKTGMGQSWGYADTQKSASVFHKNQPLYDQKSGFYYQPYWQGNIMMVKEFLLDNSDTIFKNILKVDYIVGSGQHTNSHIYSINGYLFQVPFTFYTQIQLLDFPPGFENGNNARFSRVIGTECISCHNSYPKHIEGSINKYSEIPLGINCERCHGPGELHVDAMEKGLIVDTKRDADFTIVNPKRLPPNLQFEICLRCHSQGNSVLKDDKTFFDFKPGMEVHQVLDVFMEVYENDEDAFWMETHPERLKKSKCFIRSQNHPDVKPMTCLTCHFTSSMRHVSYNQTPIDTFTALCMNCHNQESSSVCAEKLEIRNSENDNCIKCHMVKTGVFDIPHVMISDHNIRITDKWKQPIKSTTEIETGKFLQLKCMTQNYPDKITWARAYIYHYEKFFHDPSVIDSAYFYLKDLNKKTYFKDWIYYYYLKQDYQHLRKLANKYFNKDKVDAMCCYQIGQSIQNLGNNDESITYYKMAIEKQPYNLEYRNKLGTAYLSEKKYNEAKAEFEFMIEENPYLSIAYNNLGYINLIQKNYNKAESFFEKALKYEPNYINAHLNLTNTFLQQGKFEKAKTYIETLVKRYPNDVEIQKVSKLNF